MVPKHSCKGDRADSGPTAYSIDIFEHLKTICDWDEMPIDEERPTPSKRPTLTPVNVTDKYYNAKGRHQLTARPWKTKAHYFQTVQISLLALMKLTAHAISGGSMEIMGMLTGYYEEHELIILDCYPLPVVGTESRVNPQSDSYEFMLNYLTSIKKGVNKSENIIGWYHSHPGFGCWLSGIDVQTQKLQQGFEDPYVAIVIDPLQTVKSGIIDIGAFRTYYDGYECSTENSEELGFHSSDYYALNVNIFVNDHDQAVINQILGLKSTIFTTPDENVDLDIWKKLSAKLKSKNSALSSIYSMNSHQDSIFKQTINADRSSNNENKISSTNQQITTVNELSNVSYNLNKLAKDELSNFMTSSLQDKLFN